MVGHSERYKDSSFLPTSMLAPLSSGHHFILRERKLWRCLFPRYRLRKEDYIHVPTHSSLQIDFSLHSLNILNHTMLRLDSLSCLNTKCDWILTLTELNSCFLITSLSRFKTYTSTLDYPDFCQRQLLYLSQNCLFSQRPISDVFNRPGSLGLQASYDTRLSLWEFYLHMKYPYLLPTRSFRYKPSHLPTVYGICTTCGEANANK